MKNTFNVLVLYYSQTGKTKAVLDIFLEPLRNDSRVNITMEEVRPKKPFPMPWPMLYFFSIVPETAYEVPVDLEEPSFDESIKYDLIILGTQVWFLSPSLPISSLLQHPKAKVFQDTPVVSVLFCRKMWRQTQGCLERRVKQLNSWIVDKVVVTAKGSQMKTLTATRDNLFKGEIRGEQEGAKVWAPSPESMEITSRQGRQLAEKIDQLVANPRKRIFFDRSVAISDTKFFYPEKVAKKSFLYWGKHLMKFSSPESRFRKGLTLLFCVSFFIKIFIGLPVWPLLYKVRMLFVKDDTNVEILSHSGLKSR